MKVRKNENPDYLNQNSQYKFKANNSQANFKNIEVCALNSVKEELE